MVCILMYVCTNHDRQTLQTWILPWGASPSLELSITFHFHCRLPPAARLLDIVGNKQAISGLRPRGPHITSKWPVRLTACLLASTNKMKAGGHPAVSWRAHAPTISKSLYHSTYRIPWVQLYFCQNNHDSKHIFIFLRGASCQV